MTARTLSTGALVLALLRATPAPASTPAAATTAQVFALVVTNNRSTRLDRPDLQYADDDGARYYRLFRAVAAPEAVMLLTRFDRSSAAAHPDLASLAAPPRKAELAAALGQLRRRVAEARARGQRTQFYFVYAGHGDVELGKGYLDLEDARIDSDFLERQVVDQVAADVQHLVLDSCNSFFVVNPRKPGGRRWATPRDLALGFARRHDNVGLFLSTNTEAEVYEWSELESGIFSHEVRSGLSGAADVDGDGRVSYLELAGFVEQANAGLARGELRPHIFFRGPAGDDGASLFTTAGAQGRRLVLDPAEQRAWVRGPAGDRLIDLHKEGGPLTVLVPAGEQGLSVVQWRPGARIDAPPTISEVEIPGGSGVVSLAALAPRPVSSAARGGAAMFANLFQSPYGPRAFAQWQRQRAAAPEPVYGLGAADESRMRHYLTFIADSEKLVWRGFSRALMATGGFLLLGSGASYFAMPRWEGQRDAAVLAGAMGVGIMGIGLNMILSKPWGQSALESFEAELRAAPENNALAVARTESFLDRIAAREALTKRWTAGLFVGLAISAATRTTLEIAEHRVTLQHQPASIAVGYGAAALLGLTAWQILTAETFSERMLRLYREDPDLRPRFAFTPVSTERGFGFGVAGSF